MKSEANTPKSLTLLVRADTMLQQGILAVCYADYHGREDTPRVKACFSLQDVALGDINSDRVIGEKVEGEVTIRAFALQTGCGVVVRDDHITYADKGLEGLVSRQVIVVPIRRETRGPRSAVLFVVQEGTKRVSNDSIEYYGDIVEGLAYAYSNTV